MHIEPLPAQGARPAALGNVGVGNGELLDVEEGVVGAGAAG